MFPLINVQRRPLPFNPSDYPGLFANFDARDVTGTGIDPSNGSPLPTWVDLVNGYNFSEASGAAQPIFTTGLQNGLPGVVFTSASNLTGPEAFLLQLTTKATMYFVIRSTVAGSDVVLLLSLSDDFNNRILVTAPLYQGGIDNFYFDFGDIFSGGRLVLSETDIYDATYIHALTIGDYLTNYRNNILKGDAGTPQNYNGTGKIPHFGVNTSEYYVCQMIFYNQAHSPEVREEITNNLNLIWGCF